MGKDAALEVYAEAAGRQVPTTRLLTAAEAEAVIEELARRAARRSPRRRRRSRWTPRSSTTRPRTIRGPSGRRRPSEPAPPLDEPPVPPLRGRAGGPGPLPEADRQAVVVEASAHLDAAGITLRAAHEALDAYWESGSRFDYRVYRKLTADAAQSLHRSGARLAATQRGSR
ncbi:hypothetical protein ACFQXA_37445 [Nocardiopsis composta]